MEYLYSLIVTYKYAILLPLVILEGPIVAVVASFLASLGVLNIVLVFVVVAIGDLLGDNIYYWIGRTGGEAFIKKYGKRFKITEEKLRFAEEKCKAHLGKTLLFGKLLQAPVLIILLAAGVTKYDYKKFLWTAALVTLPKTLLFTVIGFYFGKSYVLIDQYLKNGAVTITILVIIIGGIYYFLRRSKLKNLSS